MPQLQRLCHISDKRFTVEEIRVLSRGYCQGVLTRAEAQEITDIGKTRCFRLLKEYRQDPEGFSGLLSGVPQRPARLATEDASQCTNNICMHPTCSGGTGPLHSPEALHALAVGREQLNAISPQASLALRLGNRRTPFLAIGIADGHRSALRTPCGEPGRILGRETYASVRRRTYPQGISIVVYLGVVLQGVGQAVHQDRSVGLEQVPGFICIHFVGEESAPVLADLTVPGGCIRVRIREACAARDVTHQRPSLKDVHVLCRLIQIDVARQIGTGTEGEGRARGSGRWRGRRRRRRRGSCRWPARRGPSWPARRGHSRHSGGASAGCGRRRRCPRRPRGWCGSARDRTNLDRLASGPWRRKREGQNGRKQQGHDQAPFCTTHLVVLQSSGSREPTSRCPADQTHQGGSPPADRPAR